MRCHECKVGPGKFEGEGPLTFLAHQSLLLGGSDCAAAGWDWFRAPLGFDAEPEMIKAARDYGYCDACIKEAVETHVAGIAIWESDNGFVDGRTFGTKEAFDKALAAAEDRDERAAEQDDE